MTLTQHAPVTGLVGLGSVGQALLPLLHAAGHEVIAVDQDLDVLARASERFRAAVGDTSGTGDPNGIGGQPGAPAPVFSNETAVLSRAHLVIEAVPEDLDTKVKVLRWINAVCPDTTVVLTTSAGLPLAPLAIASGRAPRLAGLRLFTPPAAGAPAMVARTALTAEETADTAEGLLRGIGLEPVAVDPRAAADARALLLGFANRAAVLVGQGYAARDDIDTAMRLGCGLPHGPLELLDLIGLDTAHADLAALHARTGDTAFQPAALLDRLVSAGRYGRKSGAGFYRYDALGRRTDGAAAGAAPARGGELSREPTGPGPARAVRRVGVLGSGAMARGIAEAAVRGGFPTVLVARGQAKADRAVDAVGDSLARAAERGRISPADRARAAELIGGSGDLADLSGPSGPSGLGAALAGCDLVIEAAAEDIEVKRALFAALGRGCAEGTVLATTTSSLSVTECARAAGRPADVIGLHFFNPAPVMRLVEVVRTAECGEQALATGREFCERLGKVTVDCKDRTGFVVNRLLFPYLGAALALLDRPDTDIEALDAAVTRGFGYPMGPFALLDTIGLDVSLSIQERLYESCPLPAYEPSPLLEQLVAAGALGRKNKRGLTTARRTAARR